MHLLEKGLNAVSVNSYISNISPVIKYGIEMGYIPNPISFKQLTEEQRIKPIYTQEELAILLKKPNMRKCNFAEYRNWVIINFLLGTGVRARKLRSIKMKGVDLDNDLISLQVTKNRKAILQEIKEDYIGWILFIKDVFEDILYKEFAVNELYIETLEEKSIELNKRIELAKQIIKMPLREFKWLEFMDEAYVRKVMDYSFKEPLNAENEKILFNLRGDVAKFFRNDKS